MWAQYLPDVTLIDLRMPVLDGASALERIRARSAAARVLVLTTFDTDNDISRAIKAGARGYLLKDAPRDELLSYVRRIHRGETCIPAAVVAKLAAGMSTEALTPREHTVLGLLAAGKSNKQIANSLEIGETTVKSHLRGIFAKLNVLSRTEAIVVATRRGLLAK